MIRRSPRSHALTKSGCSTPGGIGTVISRRGTSLGEEDDVLNARRHRHGDQGKLKSAALEAFVSAQRPEASAR